MDTGLRRRLRFWVRHVDGRSGASMIATIGAVATLVKFSVGVWPVLLALVAGVGITALAIVNHARDKVESRMREFGRDFVALESRRQRAAFFLLGRGGKQDDVDPVLDFFEGLGYALKNGLITVESAYQDFDAWIEAYWLTCCHYKRHAAALALREFAHLSDRMIAGMCGVSQTFMGSVRRELSTVDSCGARTGRDGKARRLPAKAVAATNADPVETNPTTGDGRESHRAIMEIARNMARVEEEMIEAAHQYPSQGPALLGFIAKLRNDLKSLGRQIRGQKRP